MLAILCLMLTYHTQVRFSSFGAKKKQTCLGVPPIGSYKMRRNIVFRPRLEKPEYY